MRTGQCSITVTNSALAGTRAAAQSHWARFQDNPQGGCVVLVEDIGLLMQAQQDAAPRVSSCFPH